MFLIPTFRLKLQPSSGESDKNLHRERTYNEEKCKCLVFGIEHLIFYTVYQIFNQRNVLFLNYDASMKLQICFQNI